MKKKLAILILAVAIVALWVTPAFAAQGQITEVNPSGTGTVTIILQADDGEEVVKVQPASPGEINRNPASDDSGTASHFTECLTQGDCTN